MNQTSICFLLLDLNRGIHHSSQICCYNKVTASCLISNQNYSIFSISFLLISFCHSILYSFEFLLLKLNCFTIFHCLFLITVLFCFRNIFLIFHYIAFHIMPPFQVEGQFFNFNQRANYYSILFFLVELFYLEMEF